ncbi:MAG TPA: TetR/AcrR family transcriptional regulator [Syntrophales bacterium]|nr:TetR/AcrR family transcriptional regulator [Syntrophales bacterium]
MEKSKRKEMEFQLRRNEILSEAEKIFALKGFHNATMAEIANAAGFSIGTLYHFFDGKQNLYATMVTEKLEKMYSEIRESVNREEMIIDKIKKLVESQFNFVENNVDFCDLLIRGEGTTVSEGGTLLKEKLITDYFKHVDFVADIMRMGTNTKILRANDPQMMAYTLLGIIRSFIYYWMFRERDTHLSDKVDCAKDIFLKGIILKVK